MRLAAAEEEVVEAEEAKEGAVALRDQRALPCECPKRSLHIPPRLRMTPAVVVVGTVILAT